MKKLICTLGLCIFGVSAFAENVSPFVAQCKVVCIGSVCGGEVVAEFETTKNVSVALTGSFKGINVNVSLTGKKSSSFGSPELENYSVGLSRSTLSIPYIEVLATKDISIDQDALVAGGRMLIRADWYDGKEIGNLAAQCLLIKN